MYKADTWYGECSCRKLVFTTNATRLLRMDMTTNRFTGSVVGTPPWVSGLSTAGAVTNTTKSREWNTTKLRLAIPSFLRGESVGWTEAFESRPTCAAVWNARATQTHP